jgi:UDP-2-acetamido-2,6-beta-L-arabino-hexul-4-ose reductase
VKVLLTGAAGFLGWHTRARLRALTNHHVMPVNRGNWSDLPRLAIGAEAVLHLAGINRAEPAVVEQGNVDLALDLASAVRRCGASPVVIFANSIHADSDTPYGAGKRQAASLLEAAARDVGGRYVDVRLPNLFGEHGQPHYNSFVATFVDCIVRGVGPEISDRPVNLMHVQEAAEVLIGCLISSAWTVAPPGTPTTVQQVYGRLRLFDGLYQVGDIPPLLTNLDVNLFNTLRAARFPDSYPIPISRRADHRGDLTELVRAHGGQGQTFLSTTRPGATRGEHFHLRKIERFVVIGGQARISLRRLFSDRVVSFDVEGEMPAVVDMPTLWAHHITNTGDRELTTIFWANELFDPDSPDTFPEPVDAPELVQAGGA